MNKNKQYKNLFREIKKAIVMSGNNVAILMHINPDIDCLGSAFALKEVLEGQFNKTVTIFNTDTYTNSSKKIFDISKIKKSKFNNKDIDLLISVDVSTRQRLGIYQENYEQHPNTIKIDHHLNIDSFGKIELVNSNYSSCSEVLLELFKFMKVKFTEKIATYLYAGLSADSGSFKNANTNYQSFEHALFLTKLNADRDFINDCIYRAEDMEYIKVTKFLYNHFEIIDGQIAYVVVTLKDLENLGVDRQACDGFSSKLNSIDGIKVACSIMEVKEKEYKISFRSRNDYEISHFAEILGGGGHLNAAGATVYCSKNLAKQKAIAVMKECIIETEAKFVN